MTPLASSQSDLSSEEVNIGVMGSSLAHDEVAARGYSVDIGPLVTEVAIPYGADGGFRKVSGTTVGFF